eukprot:Hpha_TRINITY_DN16945_c1_g1::TRINITY_DN16945_c1_g1_i1::g.54652::m.54652/K11412/SIRT2, SIR2L2; NAD-dependent deacetylase sirtuin 2
MADSVDKLADQVAAVTLEDQGEKEKEPVLKSFDLDGVVEYIKENACKNIVIMTGAGISTAAGIPDFRTPGTGLYSNLQKYDLPFPEAVFHIDYFKKNPDPFYMLARELWPGRYRATRFHHFVRLLDQKGVLLRNYTQNIDGLEGVAGVREERVIAAHGDFTAAHCVQCHKKHPIDFVREHCFDREPPEVPRCGCGKLVKPNIVFFGEGLPERFHRHYSRDLKQADLLIVAGTSLVVQPFAGLVEEVGPDVPRLVINREEVGQELGLEYGKYRDAFVSGTCDDTASRFADAMGWRDELDAIQAEFERRFEAGECSPRGLKK